MLDFKVDSSKCTLCAACALDCPAMIIEMGDSAPFIKEENEKKCYKCQHCVAVCPESCLSILGVDPYTCVPAEKSATAEQFDALIRSRRTVRRFSGETPAEKQRKIIEAAANAPTGKNARQVMLTVIDNAADMNGFKELFIRKIEEADKAGKLQGAYAAFATRAKLYRDGKDFIFRGAPHFMLATCPKDAPTPQADCFIALSYAELMAHTLDVGVIWAGFVMYLFELFPEASQEIGVPENHIVCYGLLYGESGVKYARGVKRDDIALNRPKLA